ncbi:hypothetical protein L596_001031 [Steinernema carpocapsae]|uniref:Uncharacterized protein n=1 Tax=Steinernema carpocapsae TaxID=34508 RepID=A0A4U8UK83_STECR|nr:hypothetical protein L596_001031 [Steinernema carpocapsae]
MRVFLLAVLQVALVHFSSALEQVSCSHSVIFPNNSYIVGVTADCRMFAYAPEDIEKGVEIIGRTSGNWTQRFEQIHCPPNAFDVLHSFNEEQDHLEMVNRLSGKKYGPVPFRDVFNLDFFRPNTTPHDLRNLEIDFTSNATGGYERDSSRFVTRVLRRPLEGELGPFHLEIGVKQEGGEIIWQCQKDVFNGSRDVMAMFTVVVTEENYDREHNPHITVASVLIIFVYIMIFLHLIAVIVTAWRYRQLRIAKMRKKVALEVLKETYCWERKHMKKRAFLLTKYGDKEGTKQAEELAECDSLPEGDCPIPPFTGDAPLPDIPGVPNPTKKSEAPTKNSEENSTKKSEAPESRWEKITSGFRRKSKRITEKVKEEKEPELKTTQEVKKEKKPEGKTKGKSPMSVKLMTKKTQKSSKLVTDEDMKKFKDQAFTNGWPKGSLTGSPADGDCPMTPKPTEQVKREKKPEGKTDEKSKKATESLKRLTDSKTLNSQDSSQAGRKGKYAKYVDSLDLY